VRIRNQESGRRKKEEGRRKKEEAFLFFSELWYVSFTGSSV